jgi:hypothetical protein
MVIAGCAELSALLHRTVRLHIADGCSIINLRNNALFRSNRSSPHHMQLTQPDRYTAISQPPTTPHTHTKTKQPSCSPSLPLLHTTTVNLPTTYRLHLPKLYLAFDRAMLTITESTNCRGVQTAEGYKLHRGTNC